MYTTVWNKNIIFDSPLLTIYFNDTLNNNLVISVTYCKTHLFLPMNKFLLTMNRQNIYVTNDYFAHNGIS